MKKVSPNPNEAKNAPLSSRKSQSLNRLKPGFFPPDEIRHSKSGEMPLRKDLLFELYEKYKGHSGKFNKRESRELSRTIEGYFVRGTIELWNRRYKASATRLMQVTRHIYDPEIGFRLACAYWGKHLLKVKEKSPKVDRSTPRFRSASSFYLKAIKELEKSANATHSYAATTLLGQAFVGHYKLSQIHVVPWLSQAARVMTFEWQEPRQMHLVFIPEKGFMPLPTLNFLLEFCRQLIEHDQAHWISLQEEEKEVLRTAFALLVNYRDKPVVEKETTSRVEMIIKEMVLEALLPEQSDDSQPPDPK